MRKMYELIKDGKFYDSFFTTSIKKAREYFNYKWTGNFTIICTGNDWERRNVRLK